MRKSLRRAARLAPLFRYLWQERIWWMIPLVLLLLLLGGVIFLSQSAAVSPFIYTLF